MLSRTLCRPRSNWKRRVEVDEKLTVSGPYPILSFKLVRFGHRWEIRSRIFGVISSFQETCSRLYVKSLHKHSLLIVMGSTAIGRQDTQPPSSWNVSNHEVRASILLKEVWRVCQWSSSSSSGYQFSIIIRCFNFSNHRVTSSVSYMSSRISAPSEWLKIDDSN